MQITKVPVGTFVSFEYDITVRRSAIELANGGRATIDERLYSADFEVNTFVSVKSDKV